MVETEKILRGRESDEAAGLQKGDARGKEESFANVVGDEDDGFIEAASKSAEFALKFGARDGIESAEGLIHEKDRRVGSEGAGDTHALALAARKFAWMAGRKFGGIETN